MYEKTKNNGIKATPCKMLPDLDDYYFISAGYYAIFLNLAKRLNLHEEIEKILKLMYDMYIVDVIIIVRTSLHNSDVYTYNLYDETYCRAVRPSISNTFENGKFKYANLYPNKFDNFYNCTLRIMGRNVAPYFIYDAELQTNNIDRKLTGIEGEMLKVIAKKLNFQIEINADPEKFWGTVYENGTMTGPFKLIDDEEVDVLMGYYFKTANRNKYFSESVSYLRSPMVLVAKRPFSPDRLSETWLFDPFHKEIWWILLIYITVVIVIMNMLKPRYVEFLHRRIFMHDHMRFYTWMDVIGTVIGSPRSMSTSSAPLRCVLIIWCSAFMIFDAAYQGKLFAAYNRINLPRSYTLSDLIVKKYTFLLKDRSYMIEENFNVPADRLIYLDVLDSYEVYVRLLNTTGNVATVAMYFRILNFIASKNLFFEFHTVPQIVNLQQMCAYFERHSFLVKPFNKIIGMLLSFGIITKWHDDANYKIKKYENLQLAYTLKPNPLTLPRFRLVFIGYIIFMSFTCVVFISELLINRYKYRVARKK